MLLVDNMKIDMMALRNGSTEAYGLVFLACWQRRLHGGQLYSVSHCTSKVSRFLSEQFHKKMKFCFISSFALDMEVLFGSFLKMKALVQLRGQNRVEWCRLDTQCLKRMKRMLKLVVGNIERD